MSLCMLYTSCPFPTVVEYIHFLWATDFLWCAWFSLALSLFSVCVCACMCMYFLHWMNASSFLGLLTFYGVLGFHLPFFFFLYVCVCVCVCTRARVCAFSTDECIYFPWAVDFLWCAWFSLSLSFFLCVPNVSVVQLIQVRSNMYELSS